MLGRKYAEVVSTVGKRKNISWHMPVVVKIIPKVRRQKKIE